MKEQVETSGELWDSTQVDLYAPQTMEEELLQLRQAYDEQKKKLDTALARVKQLEFDRETEIENNDAWDKKWKEIYYEVEGMLIARNAFK